MHETACLLTIRDWLRFAVSRFHEAGLFYGHGTDNAWDEAVALVLPSLHLPLDARPEILDARLTDSERNTLLCLLNRRIEERIPVPYLTREAWFAGLSFYVDERVLIPRSPLAELIQNHFEPWITSKPKRILDLCTGSGCIAIACAQAFPEAQIDATDLSEDALKVAKINLERLKISDRIKLYHADLFKGLPPEKYDIIISNPPYVDTSDMLDLPKEYLHEPVMGLAAGEDGLDFIKEILRQAADWLTHNGILVVEAGNSETALCEKLPEVPFTWLDFRRSDGGVFLLHANEL